MRCTVAPCCHQAHASCLWGHAISRSHRPKRRSVTAVTHGTLRPRQVAQLSCQCVAESSGAVQELGTQGATQILLRLQVVPSISEVKQADWDACAIAGGEMNPFLLWSFLNALEESGSAVKAQGWIPQHVLLYDDSTSELMGCVPLYLKTHSYGEYVFDHSWASTHMRCGLPYYPKLQSCVPFTPVTGNRLLVKPGPNAAAVTKALAKGLLELTDQFAVSSLHLTFNTAEESNALADVGYLQRSGIQYHWENRGYTTFEDFLADLKQSKRKNIRQERKSVANAGLKVKRLTGDDIKPAHWEAFYQGYINTTDRKWGQAYLTHDFFHCLGQAMSEKVLLVMAEDADTGKPMAGALNLIGSDALFGRNWGCMYGSAIKNLHFELCYYQAIEAAIERGLSRVEAGAQGEHKIQRGYLPSLTYSSHYIRDGRVSAAIEDYLRRENHQIMYQLDGLTMQASPYKPLAAAKL